MNGVPDYHTINTTIEKEKIIQTDVDKEFENQPSCNEIKENDKESDRYGSIMKQMAKNYTNIHGKKGSVYSSDYCPFEARGYVVIGTMTDQPNQITLIIIVPQIYLTILILIILHQ
jgi:hypothetical protein